jgi:hypothetical protein
VTFDEFGTLDEMAYKKLLVRMKGTKLRALIRDCNREAQFYGGADDALVGFGSNSEGPVVAIYSESKLITVTRRLIGKVTEDEIKEYIYGNMVATTSGPNSPVILTEP